MYALKWKRNRITVVVALGFVAWTSGCETAREENFDRSNLFTDIAAQTNLNAPSDVSGFQGQATYTGATIADFGGFGGTADMTLTADFDAQTIAGSMTSWEDLSPLTHVLRGQVQISNGAIANDGSFTSDMAGNIERNIFGLNDPSTQPIVMVFSGSANGQIYDSTAGASASHLNGSFSGTDTGGGAVGGSFVAKQ
jgi:hypothetical protein